MTTTKKRNVRNGEVYVLLENGHPRISGKEHFSKKRKKDLLIYSVLQKSTIHISDVKIKY